MLLELEQVQKILEWVKTKLYLTSIAPNAKSRFVKRGQVYQCHFGYGIGSEMQKTRPAIIVQNDVGNSHSGNTIVIPITHDTSTLPCTVNIHPKTDASGNIILDGQANTSNILCVSKARLGNLICNLSTSEMKSIDEALAKTLNLMTYYSDLKQNLDDKLSYISKIKLERNKAQDELIALRKILGLSDFESLPEHLLQIQKMIDNAEKCK